VRLTWVRRGGILVGGALIGALMLAGSAWAHVTVSPSTAPQGGFTAIVFRVPTESDTASTTKVDVHFDMTKPIATVDYQALPGWTTKVTTAKLTKPITDDDGNQVTQAVSEIVWTADSSATAIKPGQFLDFPVELGPLPKAPSIAFKTLQTYSDGSVVRWIDATAPGGRDHPMSFAEHSDGRCGPGRTATTARLTVLTAPSAPPGRHSSARD